ncbi:MAG: hypothetical protein IKZ06_03265 [Oscillospiraceae bacterium]|nr:hypothetical protein [Oscillospiraceae bacterium]
MEYENDFARKGVAGAGLGLGIAGTALGVLNGGLGNILGGYNRAAECAEDHCINRYELNMQNTITNKDMEIAYLKGRDAAKTDSLELYRYVDGKLGEVNDKLAAQAVINAQIVANMGCMQNSINVLNGLTKVAIPNTSICPGWGNVTVAPATTTTG